jgi:hypothetical protein
LPDEERQVGRVGARREVLRLDLPEKVEGALDPVSYPLQVFVCGRQDPLLRLAEDERHSLRKAR